MSTINYDKNFQIDGYGIDETTHNVEACAWYGGNWIEISSDFFKNRNGTLVFTDRSQLEQFSKIVQTILKDTENMGYFEQRDLSALKI